MHKFSECTQSAAIVKKSWQSLKPGMFQHYTHLYSAAEILNIIIHVEINPNGLYTRTSRANSDCIAQHMYMYM